LAKNIKLNTQADLPLTIFGIVSNEKVLKLSWSINQLLQIRLSQSTGLTLHDSRSGHTSEFSLFQFDDEKNNLKYSLLENRTKTTSYFTELKNIDHFLFIRGEIESGYNNVILNTLKKSSDFISILTISPDKLKSKKSFENF
jgi:hypothetical protein